MPGRERTEVLMRDAELSPEAARLNAVPAGHPLGYRDCFAAFVRDVYDAIEAGPAGAGSPLYPTFADAARTARVTEAVLRSAASRSWTEV
jgi:predicted dehydrogenase